MNQTEHAHDDERRSAHDTRFKMSSRTRKIHHERDGDGQEANRQDVRTRANDVAHGIGQVFTDDARDLEPRGTGQDDGDADEH